LNTTHLILAIFLSDDIMWVLKIAVQTRLQLVLEHVAHDAWAAVLQAGSSCN